MADQANNNIEDNHQMEDEEPKKETKRRSNANQSVDPVDLDEVDIEKLAKPALKGALKQALQERAQLNTDLDDANTAKAQLENDHSECAMTITELKNENSAQSKEIERLKGINTACKSELDKMKADKEEMVSQLAKAEKRVDDLQNLNAEYRKNACQMDEQNSPTVSNDTAKPYVLLIFDASYKQIANGLSSTTLRFKEQDDTRSIGDLVKRINDPNFIDYLINFNKLVICLGQMDIMDGETYRDIYKKLHRALVNLCDKISIDITLIEIQPNGNDGKRMQVDMFNEMIRNQKLKQVNTISMKELNSYANYEILEENMFTPNSLGIKTMIEIIQNNLTATMIKPVKKASAEGSATETATSSKTLTSNSYASKAASKGTSKPKDPKSYQSKENEDPYDPMLSEVMLLPDGFAGLIIGKGGKNAHSIKNNTEVKHLRVDKFEDAGKESDAVYITGTASNIEKAKSDIRRRIADARVAKRKSEDVDTMEMQRPLSKFRRN